MILHGGWLNSLVWAAMFLLQALVIPVAVTAFSNKKKKRTYYTNGAGLAFLLGLLGTVAAMMRAFSGLAGEAGPGKAQILASAVSSAMWLTLFSVVISVQFLILYGVAYFRNRAAEPQE